MRVSAEASCHLGQITKMSWTKIGHPEATSNLAKLGNDKSIALKSRKIKVLILSSLLKEDKDDKVL